MGDNSTYRDMYDQQLSRELTKGRGLGLAPMIVRQLERSTGTAPSAPVGASPLPAAAANSTRGFPLNPTLSNALPLTSSDNGVSLTAMPTAPTPIPTAADAQACPPDAPLDCSSPEAFVRSIWPHAKRTAEELGVSPKALVAQAALETGWGRRLVGHGGTDSNGRPSSSVTSHNLFGIKAGSRWHGDRVNAGTHEFVGGVRRAERADFRAYASAGDSFADYARLLGGSRYADARAAGHDTRRFAQALQGAGYATDPSYANKITAIAEGPTLNRALAGLPGGLDRG
jgi:flagellar protein FlgJ